MKVGCEIYSIDNITNFVVYRKTNSCVGPSWLSPPCNLLVKLLAHFFYEKKSSLMLGHFGTLWKCWLICWLLAWTKLYTFRFSCECIKRGGWNESYIQPMINIKYLSRKIYPTFRRPRLSIWQRPGSWQLAWTVCWRVTWRNEIIMVMLQVDLCATKGEIRTDSVDKNNWTCNFSNRPLTVNLN